MEKKINSNNFGTQKYICMDRDGTVIKLVPHLTNLSDAEFLPGVIEGCKLLKNSGFKFGIFTNQSVIGRGLGTWTEVNAINNFIRMEFLQNGIEIDFCFVCPHTSMDMCDCRKPNVGMGLQAIEEFDINSCESYMVGDNLTDVEFGLKLGMKTVYLTESQYSIASITSRDFYGASKWIVSQGVTNEPETS